MSRRKLPDGFESRVASIELRADEGPPTIVGHAAVFNSHSLDLGAFREIIEPGAFSDAIGNSDIRALFNHDPNFVLGRTSSGTLKVSEDDVGLWTETTPPDTQLIRDMVLEPMKRGDLSQMSFAFRVAPGGTKIEETDDGYVRTILPGGVRELYDISPVTYPAYPDTAVAVRSLQEILETEAEREAVRLVAAQHRARQIFLARLDSSIMARLDT